MDLQVTCRKDESWLCNRKTKKKTKEYKLRAQVGMWQKVRLIVTFPFVFCQIKIVSSLFLLVFKLQTQYS